MRTKDAIRRHNKRNRGRAVWQNYPTTFRPTHERHADSMLKHQLAVFVGALSMFIDDDGIPKWDAIWVTNRLTDILRGKDLDF